MDKDQYEYLMKFIIIGNSNSGKSCLLHYFLENKCKYMFNMWNGGRNKLLPVLDCRLF